jgi:two-component system cell cycle sensor histidine kinase/response regulator CckA
VNSATTALTGRPAEYYVGRSVLENDRPRELLETWHRAIMGVFETGTPSYLDVELTVQETLRRFEARFVPERGADGSVAFVISIARDVTTNRQAEERARQSAKMEAIGRLAGGLAHDLNNQLQAVVGFTTFLARDPGLSEQGRRDVAEIDKSSDRMRSLVAQLLAFSRQQVLSPETLDLNAAVVEAQALLQRLIGPTIDMQLELEAGPKWTRVDRTQFLQVLMNLTINARDALPNGGRVVFRTRVREVKEDRPDFTGSIITAGRYVELQVADSGTGISPEHLSRIFEPFFTTKPVGKGTGLGLATVHGIVAQSRGHIKVESRLGQGTSFTILLPAAEDSGEIEVGSPPAGARNAPSGCILVVEDEDVVRQVIVRILQETGYQTVEARHGLEALDILNRDFASITLVLTDLIMPVMTGIELTRRLADTGMAIPIVWMSGHPLEAIPEAQTGAETLSFLAKPIKPRPAGGPGGSAHGARLARPVGVSGWNPGAKWPIFFRSRGDEFTEPELALTDHLRLRIPGKGEVTLSIPDGLIRALRENRLPAKVEVWHAELEQWVSLAAHPAARQALESIGPYLPEQDAIEMLEPEMSATSPPPVEDDLAVEPEPAPEVEPEVAAPAPDPLDLLLAAAHEFLPPAMPEPAETAAREPAPETLPPVPLVAETAQAEPPPARSSKLDITPATPRA